MLNFKVAFNKSKQPGLFRPIGKGVNVARFTQFGQALIIRRVGSLMEAASCGAVLYVSANDWLMIGGKVNDGLHLQGRYPVLQPTVSIDGSATVAQSAGGTINVNSTYIITHSSTESVDVYGVICDTTSLLGSSSNRNLFVKNATVSRNGIVGTTSLSGSSSGDVIAKCVTANANGTDINASLQPMPVPSAAGGADIPPSVTASWLIAALPVSTGVSPSAIATKGKLLDQLSKNCSRSELQAELNSAFSEACSREDRGTPRITQTLVLTLTGNGVNCGIGLVQKVVTGAAIASDTTPFNAVQANDVNMTRIAGTTAVCQPIGWASRVYTVTNTTMEQRDVIDYAGGFVPQAAAIAALGAVVNPGQYGQYYNIPSSQRSKLAVSGANANLVTPSTTLWIAASNFSNLVRATKSVSVASDTLAVTASLLPWLPGVDTAMVAINPADKLKWYVPLGPVDNSGFPVSCFGSKLQRWWGQRMPGLVYDDALKRRTLIGYELSSKDLSYTATSTKVGVPVIDTSGAADPTAKVALEQRAKMNYSYVDSPTIQPLYSSGSWTKGINECCSSIAVNALAGARDKIKSKYK